MSCNNTVSCHGCHPYFASTLYELSPAERFCSTYQVPVAELPTCTGCLNDQPNQLAHMDPGGCLYVSDEFEQLASEIHHDQAAALEAGAQQLLAMDFGNDMELDAEEPKKPKINVSNPLIDPLFALPCGFTFPDCAICYEQIQMVNVAVTTCGHSFHASCAFKAINSNNCCPMCRHQLVNEGCDEGGHEGGREDESEEESEEEVNVSLEQLTGKLTNMGYTMTDIIKSLLPSLKSDTNESRYTLEFGDQLHYDIHDIMVGTITLTHRDTRSYAAVVGVP